MVLGFSWFSDGFWPFVLFNVGFWWCLMVFDGFLMGFLVVF